MAKSTKNDAAADREAKRRNRAAGNDGFKTRALYTDPSLDAKGRAKRRAEDLLPDPRGSKADLAKMRQAADSDVTLTITLSGPEGVVASAAALMVNSLWHASPGARAGAMLGYLADAAQKSGLLKKSVIPPPLKSQFTPWVRTTKKKKGAKAR